MERVDELRDLVEELIDEGRRPSARLLAEELGWSGADVHRCLNVLEKEGEIESYRKEVMEGEEMRMVGLYR